MTPHQRHIDDFLAHDSGKRFNEFRKDSQDILAAFLESAGKAPGELTGPSIDSALQSVVPRLKKQRLHDTPQLVRAFVEYAGSVAGLKDAPALGAAAEKRGKELAKEDEAQRKPVVKAAGIVGRNDPCPCGSGKKSKKCCSA